MTRLVTPRGTSDDGDTGLTLVELLVAGLISVIVMALVGTLLIRAIQTQQSVASAADTTNQARLAFDDIQSSIRLAVETDVRNASDMSVSAAGGQGDVLILKSRRNQGTVASASTWRCVAWYLAPDRKLHRLVVAPPPTTGTAPMRVSAPAAWPVVATGVGALGAAPAFKALDPSPDVDAWYPGSIALALKFQDGTSRVPVDLESTITPRRQLQLDGETAGGLKCA